MKSCSMAHLGVDIDKANPDGSINLSLPNVFGRGEMLSLKCKSNLRNSNPHFYLKWAVNFENMKNHVVSCQIFKLTFSKHFWIKRRVYQHSWNTIILRKNGQMFARSKWLPLQHSPTHFHQILLSSQLVCPPLKLQLPIKIFSVSSRLANILGLSSRDIPLCLREQFGYAKKNSLIFEAQYDTTRNYKYNVVPVSL